MVSNSYNPNSWDIKAVESKAPSSSLGYIGMNERLSQKKKKEEKDKPKDYWILYKQLPGVFLSF